MSEIQKRRRMKLESLQEGNLTKPTLPKFVVSFFSRLFLSVIATLLIFIALKANKNLKTAFYRYVYEENFNFASVNQWFQSSFGSPMPFRDLFEKTEPVFHETLVYQEENKYLNGVSLTVEKGYLVPALEDGLVIYVGKKEEYGNTVIVQQKNGIEVWYGNLKESNVSLYDYIEGGSLLGEVDTSLYLVFEKDGSFLDYHDYL